MGLLRDDFIRKYWRYYNVLEDECAGLCAYVEFDEDNFDTYSSKITRLILSVCSEFDHICRFICGISDETDSHITDYAKVLLEKDSTPIPDINNVYTFMTVNTKLIIWPFKDWDVKCASQSLFWWYNYTELKHNRGLNYKKGNLKTLLYSMAALYSLESYAFKVVANKEKEMNIDCEPIFDIPPDKSKLFGIEIETKFSLVGPDLYAETVE